MVKVRDSLALDQVIAAAEAITDPKPELMDVYEAELAAEKITMIEYLTYQTGLTLALLAWMEPE